MHLPNALWAYRNLPKSATDARKRKGRRSVAERREDLEGLHEKREKSQERSRRYRQKMTEAYAKITKERVFTEGQLVLKVTDYVRRGMAGPSKFAPKWEGPPVIREAHQNGYYRLTQMDGRDLMDPINGKWLKCYYA